MDLGGGKGCLDQWLAVKQVCKEYLTRELRMYFFCIRGVGEGF